MAKKLNTELDFSHEVIGERDCWHCGKPFSYTDETRFVRYCSDSCRKSDHSRQPQRRGSSKRHASKGFHPGYREGQ